jgi:hypothetical protein
MTVSANAQDDDGVVASVAFYANGALIGTDTSSPFSVAWSGVGPGSYSLTAVATDNQGAETTSAAVSVTVAASNAPPQVSIAAPAAGSSFTAPASVAVSATATDSDGTIASVAFYANGSPIGADNASPFAITWSQVGAGTYALTAVATDNLGATTTSAPVSITVNQIPGRLNMARATNGGVATASSTYNANYPASGAINGDRKGLQWGAGGGWNDGTPNQTPDWLEVTFDAPKAIDEVSIFSMQDAYWAPLEPTPTMTFIYYGLRHFEIQYWTGAAWAPVPGGAVTNNNLVWRKLVFAPVVTTKIRALITGGLGGYSRVMELEAWGVPAGSMPGNEPPTVALASPADGSVFMAPVTVNVDALASDSDGTIQQVAFFANGVAIGTDTTSPYSVAWSPAAGSYSLTAVATDSAGATTTSAAVQVVVEINPGRMNVALAANGGAATASSTLSANYPPAGAINGDRKGLGWGAGGGWNDATQNITPDWLEVTFDSAKTIDEVNVFSMQDTYNAPLEPTPTMTFTYYGLRAFEVQYWNGAAWVTVPGGAVTNNSLVWRRVQFAPITTTKIRLLITGGLFGYSRVMEVEAWGVDAGPPAPEHDGGPGL